MKKILSFLMCIAILLGTLPISAAGSNELLHCDSFETKASGLWSASLRPAEYSEEIARTGNVSLKVPGNEGHQRSIITFFPKEYENNKTYYLSYWVYGTGDVPNTRAEVSYYVDGKRKQTSYMVRAFPVGKWTKYEINFTINETTANPLTNSRVLVNVYGLCDVYIDDIELYKGARDIAPLKEWNDADPEKQEIKGETLDLYVDGNAAEGGNGTKESPFKSFVAARDYVRTINKDMDKNIAVNIMDGVYELTETFTLDERDSGSNGYYVIWRAAEGAEVTISGGRRITEWTESEIPGVYKTHNVGDTMRNLFVNDKPAQRARLEEYVVPLRWYNDESNSLSEKDGVVLPKGIIKNAEAATNLEVFKLITFRGNWAVKGKAIEIDDGTIISFAQPAYKAHELSNMSILTWNITDDFRLENALEFLDKPGEWFQDIDTDTLYYMPKEGENIAESEIIAPVLENMVDVFGESPDNQAHHIAFEGLTFAHGGNDYTSRRGRTCHQSTNLYVFDDTEGFHIGWYTDRGSINFNNASHILFRKNIVKNMSSVGITAVTGVEESIFDGNAFYQTASAAMTVGSSNSENGVLDRDLIPRNITFSNNIITEASFEYPSSGAFQAYYVNGMYTMHNVLYNTYYSGICMGWGWEKGSSLPQRRLVLIGNKIWNSNMFGQDGSGIYTLGNSPKSYSQYNYISYIPGTHYRPQFYHDSGSSYWVHYRDVVFSGLPIMTQNWISPYTGSHHDLQIIDCYTDNEKRSYVAKDTIESNTGFNPDGSWSKDARYAISQAGLSEGYEYLYDIVPNWEEQTTSIKNVTLQTKEQDNATPVTLKTGGEANLQALYESYNGEFTFKDNFLSVESSDTSVVQCDGAKIKAIGPGGALITAVTDDNRELIINVTVDDEGKKVELLATKNRITVGDVAYMKYILETKYWSYTPANSTHEFISSNPHIATIDDMGVVRGLKNGQTTITLRVTYDGKVFEDSMVFMVKDKSVAPSVSLNKYLYEVSEDKKIDATISLGDKKMAVTDQNTSVAFESILGEKKNTEEEISPQYTSEMRRLVSAGIMSGSLDVAGTLTEEEFLKMIENATGRTRESMNIVINKDDVLTRERMAYMLANAIRYTWGNTFAGATRLTHVADRADISPEYIQSVASVVKYELCFIKEKINTFRPKDAATVMEASMTIFRMLNAKEIRNAEYPEGWFNRAYEGEGNSRGAFSINRTATNKTLTETEINSYGISLPEETGSYKININSTYKGDIVSNEGYCFVYDKNNIYNSDEYSVAHIGKNAKGMVLSEGDSIRVISETGDVWDYEDSLSYVYKEISDEDYEISATISGVARTHDSAAGGLMYRTSTESNAVKIDYRVQSSGATFLCWRTRSSTTAEGATYYETGKILDFPVTMRLVKKGTKFIAYYKEGDQWIENMSFDVGNLKGNITAGLMQYSLTNLTKVPSSAVFSNIYFGKIRQLENVVDREIGVTQKPAETQKPTGDVVTPSEDKEPEKVSITLDRNRFLDAFVNGGFENGISGWSVSSGKVAASDVAYKGSSALRFTPSAQKGYVSYSLPSINKNKTYYLAFRAKTKDGTVEFSPYIQYSDGNSTVKTEVEFLTDKNATADEWKEFIVKFKFVGSVSKPNLILNMSGKSEVYIDNVELLYQ